MQNLFIQYANTDFKKSQSFFLELLKTIIAYNAKIRSDLTPYMSESFNFNSKEQTSPLPPAKNSIQHPYYYIESLFEKVDQLIQGGYQSDSMFFETFQKKIALKTRKQGDFWPYDFFETEIAWLALDAVYRSKVGNCCDCRFNRAEERSYIIDKNPQPQCHKCDQAFFRRILDQIISGEDFLEVAGMDLLLKVQNEVIVSQTILNQKDGIRNDVVWFTWSLFNFSKFQFTKNTNIFDQQSFARFIMGCVGYNLLNFLMSPPRRNGKPENRQYLTKCNVCSQYFIGRRFKQKKCRCCQGEKTTEEKAKRSKQQKEKYDQERRKKKEQDDKNDRKAALDEIKSFNSPAKIAKMEETGELEEEINEIVIRNKEE